MLLLFEGVYEAVAYYAEAIMASPMTKNKPYFIFVVLF